jgi:hypothetical protein
MIAVIAGQVDPRFPKKPMTVEQAQEARVMMAAGGARSLAEASLE